MNVFTKGINILKRKSRAFIETDQFDAVLDRLSVISDIYIPAYALHQKVFPKYKGINRGKTVVIVGTGPSLDYFQPIKDAIYIGVNHAIFKDNIKLDYLFMTDNYEMDLERVFSIEKSRVNFFGVKYSQSGQLFPEYIYERQDVEMFYVDSFNYSLFGKEFDKAGKLFYPLDLSISPMKSYGSIIFCAFQFALWTHPDKIYIVGADCSTGRHASSLGHITEWDSYWYTLLVEPWKKSKEFAENFYPDIEIFSVNPVGLKGVFKDVFTENFKL